MSIIHNYLKSMMGKYVVIVQNDAVEFRGLLKEYDEECLVLEDIIEISIEHSYWRLHSISVPSKYPGIEDLGYKSSDENTVIVPMNHGVFRIDSIMRIWLWPAERLSLDYDTPMDNIMVQKY